jgi:hypothetical protein
MSLAGEQGLRARFPRTAHLWTLIVLGSMAAGLILGCAIVSTKVVYKLMGELPPPPWVKSLRTATAVFWWVGLGGSLLAVVASAVARGWSWVVSHRQHAAVKWAGGALGAALLVVLLGILVGLAVRLFMFGWHLVMP